MNKIFSKILPKNKLNFSVILVTLTAAFVCILYLVLYLGGEVRGNFDWLVLPGKMFGVPQEIVAKGFEPLYNLPGHTGWDGQFYYYISNDLLALKDTAEHIDANAYRYQRIGLPFLAKVLSLTFFQDWVSPEIYYLTSFIIIISATYFLASWINKQGYSPWLTLFWSLGIGTQLTLLNGLPDAAADGLLIMAVLLFINNKKFFYSIFITLAALSREAYIAVAFFIFLFSLAKQLKLGQHITWKTLVKDSLILSFPGIIFIAWQIYIRIIFHVSPREQAHNILGGFLVSTFNYFWAGITNSHEIFSPDIFRSARESLSIFIYVLLLILTIKLIVSFRKLWSLEDNKTIVLISFLPVFLLYTFFGNTVMMHYTGYMKAATILFFIIPLIYITFHKSITRKIIIFLVISTIFYNSYLLNDRILTSTPSTVSQYSQYPKDKISLVKQKQSCLADYKSKVKLLGMEDFYDNPIFPMIRLQKRYDVFEVELTNITNTTWEMVQDYGSVRMSYQWLTLDQKQVVLDGIRAFIPSSIAPNQNVKMKMIVEFPSSSGEYILRLSPVQEGCTWFYLAGDKGFVDLKYKNRWH